MLNSSDCGVKKGKRENQEEKIVIVFNWDLLALFPLFLRCIFKFLNSVHMYVSLCGFVNMCEGFCELQAHWIPWN